MAGSKSQKSPQKKFENSCQFMSTDFIYWIDRPGGLTGVISDNEPLFLNTYEITGICAGSRGAINKRLVDYMIEEGKWRVVTNPLEAYTIEIWTK